MIIIMMRVLLLPLQLLLLIIMMIMIMIMIMMMMLQRRRKPKKSEQSKARGKKQVNLKRHMVYLKDFKEGSRKRAVPPLCSDYSQDDVADLLNKNREE